MGEIMDPFQDLKNQLVLTADHRIMLGSVAMILMPAWFFTGIVQRVVKEAGPETAAKIYYDAGYDGAYQWGKVQIEAGLSGREIIEQYLGSMSHRGWGRFEIVEFDANHGSGRFRLYNSAVALSYGVVNQAVCIWVPGALAGAMQVILDHGEKEIQVKGWEAQCFSQGQTYCEFLVQPN
jgi:predicted hydrocarbon binding protein